MLTLVDIARGHLEAALEYALAIPRHEPGIRRFLLWTLGMAVLTLRRVEANPHFAAGSEVKIPRRQVRATVVATSLAVRSNHALRWLFDAAAKPFPTRDSVGRSILTGIRAPARTVRVPDGPAGRNPASHPPGTSP